MKSWYAERKIVGYLSRSGFGREYTLHGQEILKTAANCRALSYLCLALESNCSILICGDDSNSNKTLLCMLADLIPSNEPEMIIEKDFRTINPQAPFFNMHNLYGTKLGVSIAQSIELALKLHPDRIIVDQICKKEANSLFHSMDFGSSFITTIKGNMSGSALITSLLSRPTSVEAGRLSCLDVSVSIDKGNSLSVCEYSWLSRGEIADGIDINGSDLLSFSDISPNSAQSLLGSKIVGMYSELTGFSKEQSIQQIEDRSKDFLSKATSVTQSKI